MNTRLTLKAYKSITLIFTFLIVANTSFPQIYEWSTQPSVGIHYSTLKTGRYSFPSGINPDEVYFQNTINVSASVPVTQRLRMGLQYITIANKVIREPVELMP